MNTHTWTESQNTEFLSRCSQDSNLSFVLYIYRGTIISVIMNKFSYEFLHVWAVGWGEGGVGWGRRWVESENKSAVLLHTNMCIWCINSWGLTHLVSNFCIIHTHTSDPDTLKLTSMHYSVLVCASVTQLHGCNRLSLLPFSLSPCLHAWLRVCVCLCVCARVCVQCVCAANGNRELVLGF